MARAISRCSVARGGQCAARPGRTLREGRIISLAFVTALQLLPPRQVAVLVLRDVLGFHAIEVAEMLDTTIESVNSSLKRARASRERRPSLAERELPRASASPSEDAIAAQFVSAWESADLDALLIVALLTDDVFISMPPCQCHRCRSNTKVETSWSASVPTSSRRAGGTTLCARELTVSRRSEPTCALLTM
jgi:Sigma-70, region 4